MKSFKIQTLSYKNHIKTLSHHPLFEIGVFLVFCFSPPPSAMESLTNHYWANQGGRQPPLWGGLKAAPAPEASAPRHWSKHRIRRNRWRHPAAEDGGLTVSQLKNVLFEGIWNFLWRWVSQHWQNSWELQLYIFVQRTRIKYITLQSSRPWHDYRTNFDKHQIWQ